MRGGRHTRQTGCTSQPQHACGRQSSCSARHTTLGFAGTALSQLLAWQFGRLSGMARTRVRAHGLRGDVAPPAVGADAVGGQRQDHRPRDRRAQRADDGRELRVGVAGRHVVVDGAGHAAARARRPCLVRSLGSKTLRVGPKPPNPCAWCCHVKARTRAWVTHCAQRRQWGALNGGLMHRICCRRSWPSPHFQQLHVRRIQTHFMYSMVRAFTCQRRAQNPRRPASPIHP